MKNKRIVIIDYQMNNLYSVKNALEMLGFNVELTHDKKKLVTADAAILPGVGAFNEAMSSINSLDLISPIKDFIDSGKPFMGICLGLQLLLTESEEFGVSKGLGVIDGVVEHFSKPLPTSIIPHVGWNQITIPASKKTFTNSNFPVSDNSFMYFVHSYYVKPSDPDVVCTQTKYEDLFFCSSILKNNIFACQFHPEKSGTDGLEVLKKYFNT